MSRPSEPVVNEALQIRLSQQYALMEWSWMVCVLQGAGSQQERKEVAIRESMYIQLSQSYRDHCLKHGLCLECNGDGEWEIEPGVIGPCQVCGGSGRGAKEVL